MRLGFEGFLWENHNNRGIFLFFVVKYANHEALICLQKCPY
jgi:hypothetical protein